jgi:integrase/recombinase XerD
MDNAIRRFLTYLERDRSRAHNTILAYRADLDQLRQVIEARTGRPFQAWDLNSETISEYASWLGSQGYRPATISRKMAAVRTFLEYLHLVEGRTLLRFSSALRPPPTPKGQPRVLTDDEVTELLDAPAHKGTARGMRDAAILALLYATGMRAAEVVSLDVDDLDWERSQVHKPGKHSYSLGLGEAEGPLRRYVAEGRQHLIRQEDERALFLNQRGQRLSRQGLWLVVKRWAQAVGLGEDISPHTLRHTLAQHLLRDGRTRKEVQRILGLSSPNTIRLYRDLSG